MTGTPRPISFPLAATLISLALGGALWLPFGSWWPEGGQKAVLLAIGSCWVTAILAHALAGRMRRGARDGQEMVNAQLAGLTIRMLLTLVAALVIMRLKVVPTMPFSIAISAGYTLLLALELFVTLRAVRQNHPPEDQEAVQEGGAESRSEPR